MSTQPTLTRSSKTVPAEWTGDVRYIARQPILDLNGRLHGYELLFRNGPESVLRSDGDMAARTVLDDAVLFGLEQYTNGSPAFVNCTAEALSERFVQVLPPSMTILVLPANVEPTPKVVDACRELKASGFRLALDNFAGDPKLQPLVELADYICADFTLLDDEGRKNFRQKLKRKSVATVAKKVETDDDYRQARAAGFTLFHGDYICHPVLLKNRKVPANRLFHFEILRQLYRDPVDLMKVSELVMRDASLTYRLLRLVNSPFCAIYQEVRSIESAILFVGEETFRRVATVGILSEVNTDRPPEILRMALMRARFCGLAAALCALDADEQYLLGILSLLPAMLGLPMDALTPSLPLRYQLREALEGTANSERSLLTWIEFHERGDWGSCDAIAQASGVHSEQLVRYYANAVAWAEATLHAAI